MHGPLWKTRAAILAASVAVAFPALAAAPTERCAAVAKSALAEPDWYLAECLGGIRPQPAAAAGSFAPGDLQFLVNVRVAGPFPDSLVTAPVGTLNYTLVAAQPAARDFFAIDFDNPAQVLWAIDSACTPQPCVGTEYGTFNQTTGVFTPAGNITGAPPNSNFSGLRFDPTDGTVYVSALTTVTTLLRLDLGTGVATPIGIVTGFPLVIDIAIDNSGQIYGHDIGADQLLRINKATAAPTAVGPTGVAANFAQGMDFDPSTNTLWAYIYLGGGVNNLSTFNLTTGAATVIVNGTAGPENEGAIRTSTTLSLVPTALAVDAAGNGVLQPNEAAVSVAPSWRNPNNVSVGPVTGTLSNFTGPTGPVYTIVDNAAAYGTIPAATTQSCGSNCYAVTAAAPTRPSLHWDATADEALSAPGGAKTWRLHVGDSFADVPVTNIFYRFIETILHRDVTGGCTATNYCPGANTTREQMAVFVLISKEGSGYNPPACVAPNLFSDVPDTSPFCKFIEELANRGVVTGCGPNLYCPTANATREQMAVFVLRTLDPTFTPPNCVAGSEAFNDVPASNPFCPYVEELARRGIVTGCGGGAYCPTAPVTREQMSVFLSGTFSLTLYGVN